MTIRFQEPLNTETTLDGIEVHMTHGHHCFHWSLRFDKDNTNQPSNIWEMEYDTVKPVKQQQRPFSKDDTRQTSWHPFIRLKEDGCFVKALPISALSLQAESTHFFKRSVVFWGTIQTFSLGFGPVMQASLLCMSLCTLTLFPALDTVLPSLIKA